MTNLVEFKVDVDDFRTYLYTVRGRFSIMLRSMIDVAKLIQANTNWRVPLEYGTLEGSYKWEIMEYSRDFIEIKVGYDAVDEKSGFHYAYYQHELPTESHYRKANRRGEMRGQHHYLFEGIKASESMAYEIIETDYLSMFGGVTNGRATY